MLRSEVAVFPPGMLSVILHHREKLSQEQRAALDASHPEVTLSCFYALRGQSTVQDRRWHGGGKVHPRRHEKKKKIKSKAGPLEMEVPWTGTRSGERADYCWLSSSGSRSEGVLCAMNQICSGVFGSYCMAIINRAEIRKNLCQGSATLRDALRSLSEKKIKHLKAHYPLHGFQKKKDRISLLCGVHIILQRHFLSSSE